MVMITNIDRKVRYAYPVLNLPFRQAISFFFFFLHVSSLKQGSVCTCPHCRTLLNPQSPHVCTHYWMGLKGFTSIAVSTRTVRGVLRTDNGAIYLYPSGLPTGLYSYKCRGIRIDPQRPAYVTFITQCRQIRGVKMQKSYSYWSLSYFADVNKKYFSHLLFFNEKVC